MSASNIYAPIGHQYGPPPGPPPPTWNPTAHHIPSPPPPIHAIPPQVSITPYWPNNSSPLLPISTLPGAPPHMAPLSGLQKDLTTRILQNMIQYGGTDYFQVSLDRMGIIPSNKDLQQWMLQPRAYLDFMTLLRLAVCLRRLVEATKLAAGPALLRNVIWQFANYVVGLGIRMAPPHLNPPELSPKLGVTRADLLQFLADLSIAIAQTRETPIATRFALYTLQLIAQYKKMESRGELPKESYSKLNLSDLVSSVVDWVVHDLNSQKGDTPTNPAMLPDLCECIRLLDSEEDKIRLTLRGLKHGLVQLETFVNFATALCPPNDPPVDEGSRVAYDMMHQTINEWQQKKRNRDIDLLLPNPKRPHIDDLPPLPPPPPQNKQTSRSSKAHSSKTQKEASSKETNSSTKRHALLKEYNTLVLKGGADPETAAKLQKIRAAMEKLLNPEQHKQYGVLKKEYLALKSQTDPPMSDTDRKIWRRKLEQFVLQCMAG